MTALTDRKNIYFPAMHNEGSPLTNEFLQRVFQLDEQIPGLKKEAYHLQPADDIGVAITAAFESLKLQWKTFIAQRNDSATPEARTKLTREAWLLPLFKHLDYGRLQTAAPIITNDRRYDISHTWNDIPIHLIAYDCDLDTTQRHIRRSPFQYMQEAVNAGETMQWGVVSNGLRLRLAHRNPSLVMRAWLEWDLEDIFTNNLFPEFKLLWLILHQSRLEKNSDGSLLDSWAAMSHDAGVRALDNLRAGVQQAITELGSGFLRHASNSSLREQIHNGSVSLQEVYHELLRLVYRFIVLLAAEDRNILLNSNVPAESAAIYTAHYSMNRLKRLARRRGRGAEHNDLFRVVRLIFHKLGRGGVPELGLPELGGLFTAAGAVSLYTLELDNDALLTAVRALTMIDLEKRRIPVDYRRLGAEELGSVYESLLELNPVLENDQFVLQNAAGNERRSSGSYYTPSSLIEALLDSALNPVIRNALTSQNPETSLLAIRVADPACGSGHFLTAAARRIAKDLAEIRAGENDPTPEQRRHALRDVISACIYGVDINPMAVELCKVSLWMEAMEQGKPLSFLNHHIKCGNSLVGLLHDNLEQLISEGIPDEAFDCVSGEDRAVAADLKKRNAKEKPYFKTLFGSKNMINLGNLPQSFAALNNMPEDTAEQLHAKENTFAQLEQLGESMNGKLVSNIWVAAFFWPLDGEHAETAPTTGEFRHAYESPHAISKNLKDEISAIAQTYKFFHWNLEFPDVMQRGGFDCVVGNPPWEQIELKEKEYFSSHASMVLFDDSGNVRKGADRKDAIQDLAQQFPNIFQKYEQERMAIDRNRKYLQKIYRLTGKGRINLYSVFAERDHSLAQKNGRMGIIVPTGIATDDTNKEFFGDLAQQSQLAAFYDFENRAGLFPAVDSRMKFAILAAQRAGRSAPADFVCFAQKTTDLADPARHFSLTSEDFALLNPNTRTLPIFRGKQDAELTKKMYRAAPIFIREGDEDGNPWEVTFRQGLFNMTSDSSFFQGRKELEQQDAALQGNRYMRDEQEWLPLYEAKLFHQYDHRFATYAWSGDKTRDTSLAEHMEAHYAPQPRYWIAREEVERKLQGWQHEWLLAFRDVTNSTNERTFIASILPKVGVGHTASLINADLKNIEYTVALVANYNALPFDYIVRNKMGGMHLSFFIVKQLPVLPPEQYTGRRVAGTPLQQWISERVLELIYTGRDIAPFAREMGYDGPPFTWNEPRRAQIRGDLDGLYAHLYGLSREEFAYILTTFPGLKKNEERDYGEYRSARLALAAYDRLAEEME